MCNSIKTTEVCKWLYYRDDGKGGMINDISIAMRAGNPT